MQKIIDLHCDTAVLLQAGIDVSQEMSLANCSLPGLRAGNMGIQVFACFVSSMVPKERAYQEALDLIGHVRHLCADPGNQIELVLSPDQAEKVIASDRTGVILAVENGHSLAEDPANLDRMFDLGVRYMTLTHSSHLSWAASSGEKWTGESGLTELGETIVARMNELGMIIDVSHVHDATFKQVLSMSRKPVIASHSNCRRICNSPRNLSDEQIRALAAQGGMMGINFFPGFLDEQFRAKQVKVGHDLFRQLDQIEKKYLTDYTKKFRAMQECYLELRRRMEGTEVAAGHIIDHIEHVLSLAGDEHVGFGSDFDGIPFLPDGLSGSRDMPVLVDIMKQRGFGDKSLERICRQNFLRVWRENYV